MSSPLTIGTDPSPAAASPRRPAVPEKPTIDGLEQRWVGEWERRRAPTASTPRREGRDLLHRHPATDRVGLAAHGHRVRLRPDRRHRPLPAHAGPEVFYPMGWDDNGLPTERRVQNYYGVALRPLAPLRPRLRAARRPGQGRRPGLPAQLHRAVPRAHRQDEQAFEDLWRRLGLSVDWTLDYATIDDRSRRRASACSCTSWRAARPTPTEAPTLWDVDFQTAVAQAELEDREQPAHTTGCASATSRSRRPGPSSWPRAWRWSPTPRTTATAPGSARPCAPRSSEWRSPCWPTTSPNPRRARASP